MIIILGLVRLAVVLILWPVLANVYAWKHDKAAGIAASTLTSAIFISVILFWILSENIKGGSIRQKFVIFLMIISLLGVISLMVLANVYAWKSSKVAGSLVSSLTVADIFMYILQIHLGRLAQIKKAAAI